MKIDHTATISKILYRFLPESKFNIIQRGSNIIIKKLVNGKFPVLFAYLNQTECEFLENLINKIDCIGLYACYNQKNIEDEKNEAIKYIISSMPIWK